MELKYLFNSLPFIKPEMVLAAVLVVIVIADLILSKKKDLLHYLAIAGIIVAGYFVLEQFSITASVFSTSGNKGMLTVDSLGAFFKGLVLTASFFVFLFSISSKEINEAKERLGEYYALLFGMILGMFFMISASDFILIYVAMEMVSLSSYVLAGITKQSYRNSEASLKYLIYGGVSSGIMLFGISLIYGLTGSTNLYEINSLLHAPDANKLILLLAGLMVFAGIGYKISAAPFHFWTPDVYEGAPITITAFLSVASKAAGFALLIRFIKVTFLQSSVNGYWQLLPAIDWKLILVAIAVLTMTLGNFAALWQDNLKRMLAYSSIAHAGYMLTGIAVLSNQGLVSVLVYFAIYAFTNLGAFLIIMLISNKIGSEDIEDFNGLGYASPFLGVCFAIFLISLTGLPPMGGFVGKLYLFIALLDAKMFTVAVIMVLNSVVSLYYYIRVLKHMFIKKPLGDTPVEIKTSFANAVVVLALAAPVLILGLYFTPLVEFAKSSISVFGL